MDDFKSLFINDIPLIDVRAPVEFDAGHFPTSINLPLMTNEERHLIGIRYKESGQDSAIQLGHELVNGKVKENRIAAWVKFKATHPTAKLYCFRGGLRSKISQQWIKEAGVEIEIIPGGYKALRHFMMETIEIAAKELKFIVLAGRTGSGKTSFFKKSKTPFIDLEKHANHRGSSFGSQGTQPAQITFENRIAVDFLKCEGASPLLIEDESFTIGGVAMPSVLFRKMAESPMIVLDRSLAERVDHIVREYVLENNQTHLFMVEGLNRIHKKLGGLNHALILKQMNEAFQSAEKNSIEPHRIWVESLLVHYYDQFYDRAIKRNAARIVFQGDERQCLDYLLSLE